ncbi:hypothetical protein B0H14DRAFT_3651946 [Mycena olivaceomarginata]|nr:hypothetical protein B0H14DRAFT_3651946 [Mycena olivaceomarginata]
MSRPARASTALPILSPRKSASSSAIPPGAVEDDNDDEHFDFQYGRSSSLPPDALSSQVPESLSTVPSSMVIVQMCPGSRLDWPVDIGPFMEMFPFHRIGIQSGSLLFNVEIHDHGTKIIAFSKVCTGEARLDSCCLHCVKIPAEVQKLVDLVVQADSRVNHRYLSWKQIRALLTDRTEEVRRWRLKLVGVGLRRGASPSAIIRMMQLALKTPDIVLMVYRLGSRKLLYAVNHGLGLPSLCTLLNHMVFTKTMPTVGTISVADVVHNIHKVVLKPCAAAAIPQPLCGVSLLIDEVVLEERACHFCRNNSIGGLCWQHSPTVNLQLKTYNDAFKIAAKIKAGDVHLGKEMTIVSALCFGESGTYPILVLPTCKFVSPTESSMIFETVAAAWIEHAAAMVDGESSQCRAGYDQFICQKLAATSPIFGTLASMVGLNIFTGIHSITLDFDYQHVFKLQRLLFPDDPQDVPRAVELMETIIEFLACDFGQVDTDTAADLDSIHLLVLVLKSILAPFITPDMSLTKQMTHLSTYTHLIFTHFRTNRLTFMSNQPYGDSHSMIKNVFFCLAKQQVLDPTQPFYLFQVGDDPLEKLFGKLCMLGGHNSAMSYAQAIEHLGQLDLDQGQRCISMNHSEGVDHLNMVSWTGHPIAGNCHIPLAWDEGSKVAQEILAKLCFPPHSYNYPLIFSDPKIDMIRPFGDGKYPGVESNVDHSIIVPKNPAATPPSSVPAPSPSLSDSSTSTFLISLSTALSSTTPRTRMTMTTLRTKAKEFLLKTLDEVPELALPTGCGVDPSDYISVEDFEPKSTEHLKRVRGHTKVNAKKRDDVNPEAILSANTFIVGDPFFTLLHTDQTLSLAVVRSTAIHKDGISCGSILALTIQNAMAKVKLSGQVLSMTMIPTLNDTLSESESALAQPRPPSHPDLRAADWTLEEKSPWSWIWNGRFLKVDSLIAGTKQTTEKVVVMSVPGILTELVNHCLVDVVPRLRECVYEINSEGRSWELDDGPMGAVCELL